MLLNLEELRARIKEVKFNHTRCIPQTNLFTPDHIKERCTIYFSGGKQYTGNFQYPASRPYKGDNEKMKNDYLQAIFLDARSFESSSGFEDFCACFGYEPNKDSRKVFLLCMKSYNNIKEMFSEVFWNSVWEQKDFEAIWEVQ